MAKLTMKESAKRFHFYRKGCIDKEIAQKCGVAQSTICAWRNKHGLPPNKSSKPGQLIVTNFKPKWCKRCGNKFKPKASAQMYCPVCQKKRPANIRPVNF